MDKSITQISGHINSNYKSRPNNRDADFRSPSVLGVLNKFKLYSNFSIARVPFLVCVCTLLISNISFAEVPKMQEQQIKSEIRTVLDQAFTAWGNNDIEGYLELYAHEESTIYVGGKEVYKGIDSIRRMLKELYGISTINAPGALSMEITHFNLLDENHALVVGLFRLEPAGVVEELFEGAVSLVFTRGADGWRAISDHAS